MDAWAPDVRRASTEYLLLVHALVGLALQRSAGKSVVDRVSPGAFAASKPRLRHQPRSTFGFDWPCPVATIPHDQQEGHTV